MVQLLNSGSKPSIWGPVGASLTQQPNLWRGCLALIPLWEGAGPPRDLSPFKGQATLVGNAGWTTDRYGRAMTFDGTEDMVDFGAPSYLNMPATGVRQLCVWFKRGQTSSGGIERLLGKGIDSDSTGFDGYVLEIDSSNVVTGHMNGDAANTFPVCGTVTDTTDWHFAEASFEIGGTCSGSLDGGVQNSVTDTNATVNDSGGRFTLGDRIVFPESFDGLIGMVAVYDRRLTESERQLWARDPFSIFRMADSLANPVFFAAVAPSGFFSRIYYDNLLAGG